MQGRTLQVPLQQFRLASSRQIHGTSSSTSATPCTSRESLFSAFSEFVEGFAMVPQYKKYQMSHYSDVESWIGGVSEIIFFLDLLNYSFTANSMLDGDEGSGQGVAD